MLGAERDALRGARLKLRCVLIYIAVFVELSISREQNRLCLFLKAELLVFGL